MNEYTITVMKWFISTHPERYQRHAMFRVTAKNKTEALMDAMIKLLGNIDVEEEVDHISIIVDPFPLGG
jgi:hypothetical protein